MKRNNKNYIIVLVLILLVGIGIGYAVINTTLNINGKSSISKNSWDIHFENIQIKDGSVEATKVPTIENNTTVDFETQLNLPGDYYEFTVDVVNDGTIDAMIESITKEPELTEEQQKYLNYTIEYENKEQITTKQLVKKESSVRLKVKVELRKDIDASDLPEVGDVLYLGFTVNYVQADENGISVNSNGMKVVNVVSGDGTQTGDEICIGKECFYVMYSDDTSVTMFAKYNLYVGGSWEVDTWVAYGEKATGRQASSMKGYMVGRYYDGITKFSNTNSTYEGSIVEGYVNNYKTEIEKLGVLVTEARLITKDELNNLGCSSSSHSCSNAPSWVYATSYWTGTANSSTAVWNVFINGTFNSHNYSNQSGLGCRPVIVISKDYF